MKVLNQSVLKKDPLIWKLMAFLKQKITEKDTVRI